MAKGPGLIVVGILTALAWILARWTSSWGIGAAAIAVVLGWSVARGDLAGPARPGVSWAAKNALLVAVVLLGFTLDLGALLAAGPRFVLLAITAVAVSWFTATILGRAFGLSKPLRNLLGIGFGVCGVAAIGATRNSLEAKDEEFAVATAVVTTLGSIGLLALPALQWSTGFLSPEAFGAWTGATLPAIPHAIGAGLAGAGLVAAAVATTVKMARVALLVPVALWVGRRGRKAPHMPLEVKLFGLAVVLGNLPFWLDGWNDVASMISKVALVAALAALGLQTRIQDLANGPVWMTSIGTIFAVLAATLWLV